MRHVVLRVFLPFAAGYCLSYAVRNINAVIAPDLTGSLGLSAASLGLLTSAYFLTFALFQLPLGILLDRFGPRRVESVLLLFAALGAYLFARGESVGELVLARAFIGLGVSACLMASFKAFVMWFPSDRLPLVYGCIMAVGGFGALLATAPLESLLGVIDWRGVFLMLAAVAVAASAAIFLSVPVRPEENAAARESTLDQVRGTLGVFSSPLFWRIAPMATASQGAFLAIQGLWAGPWLHDVAGLSRAGVAEHLALIPVSMIAGFLCMGFISDRLRRYGVRTVTVAAGGMLLFVMAQFVIVGATLVPPVVIWCVFGFFGTSGILCYAVLSQSFPKTLAGRVNTALNVLAFSAAFGAQWGLGGLIGLWPAEVPGRYEPAGYGLAFGIAAGVQLLAFVWMVWPRRSAAARFL
ncbi:MAG TPA: MFS transporter [Gammaproteobacteria bacterium]